MKTDDKEAERTVPQSIDLGGLDIVQALNGPLVAARPKPKGLLPVPPEVEALVAREDARLLKEHGIVPTAEDHQRQQDSLTLQYYFEGYDVAYRRTPQGVEVLAVGPTEIGELLHRKSQEELLKISIGQP
jgi:hypothetical protein